MTNYFECLDQYICLETGLTEGRVEKAKEELQGIKKAFFHDGWIFIPNLEEHNQYKNSPKNLPTYEKELSSIPNTVLEHFNKVLDTSIDSGIDSSMHTTLKSLTINHKSKIINHKQEIEKISQEQKQEIADKYQVPLSFVESKQDDILNWHEQNPQKNKRENYVAVLRDWVKRDALKVIDKHNDKQRYTNKYKVTKL